MRYFLFFSFLFLAQYHGSAQTVLQGKVMDAEGKALPFANLQLPDSHTSITADEAGRFAYTIANPAPAEVKVVVSYVGMKKLERLLPVLLGTINKVELVLEDNNLYLNEVEINATRVHTTNSNSSIVIEQAAIEQIQPYSLADILSNLLPGQTIMNSDLQSAKSVTLRSVANGSHAQNAQFGTAVLLDGEALSNNANLQAGGNGYGLSGAFTPGNYGSGDFTFSSIDLRQIPANNIEKIEVIQGVASAKYGDLTDGAILIDRKAGVSPWSISARIQGGTNNLGVNKGFKLSPKLGSLTASLDVLDSAPSTTNKQKSYKRLSSGLLWTTYLGPNRSISSHFGIDVATNFDNYNKDAERNDEIVKTDYTQLRLNYRGSWKNPTPLLDALSYSASYSSTSQYSYESRYLNLGVSAMSVSTEAGVSEGIFTYPNYQAETKVYGKPKRLSFSLNGNKRLTTGAVEHHLAMGGNYSTESNRGQGYDVDPYTPRWKTGSAKGQSRDFRFEQVPALTNMGLYLEDMFTTQVQGKKLKTSAGLRLDKQYKKWSVSPRVSSSLELSERTTLKAAYGISTKSPGLVHLQPKPIYFDYQLINYYPNNYKENLALYYTTIITPDNSQLKAMRSQTLEFGLSRQMPRYNVSLTAFAKKVTNGFSQQSVLNVAQVPGYAITETRPDEKPTYAPTGEYSKNFAIYKRYSNAQRTENYGLELLFNTIKFESIQTSFNISSTLYFSQAYNGDPIFDTPKAEHQDKYAFIGVYKKNYQESLEAISTLSTSHHISQLGLLVNFRAQFFWEQWTKNSASSVYPVGFYTASGQYQPIERDNPAYAHLILNEKGRTSSYQPIIFSNYHLKLSKEIHHLARLSFYANNFLNHRPEAKNTSTGDLTWLNQVPAFGMELRLTIK